MAAATDPYSHLNSLAATPQQYHQLHPAAQAAQRHQVLSRRDEENLHHQSQMHSGLPTSLYGDGGSVATSISVARRQQASDMVYASVRRPEVLMHGGHHISEQDLLNLHNAGALQASLDDGQVSRNKLRYCACINVKRASYEPMNQRTSDQTVGRSEHSKSTGFPLLSNSF